MQGVSYDTDHLPASSRAAYWTGVIADTYFPLQLTFRDTTAFRGRLRHRQIGAASLSRLTTDPLQFERSDRHIHRQSDEDYLITLPRIAPVDFRQMGRDVTCAPGAFLVERGSEPYRFSYSAPNDLCVVKVARSVLEERLRQPDRFCAQAFEAQKGIGALFSTMARHAMAEDLSDQAADVLGRQLVELLALSLSEKAETDGLTSVRAAHLRRAGDVIRANLQNPGLTPDYLARACGISKRYLHELFAADERTVSATIREQRLIAARDLLASAGSVTLAEVAYRFAFADQSQFSRQFKAMFGCSPSTWRAQSTRSAN